MPSKTRFRKRTASRSKKSEAPENQPPVAVTEEGVAAPLAAGPVVINKQEGDRTAAEKVKSINAATKKTSGVDGNKSLHELAAGSQTELAFAVQAILVLLERGLNMDFLREAPYHEVLNGEAQARASVGPTGESPAHVDDAVLPPGFSNATDEVLPPNIQANDPPSGFKDHPGVKAANSASSN